jgi:hypothetical protein
MMFAVCSSVSFVAVIGLEGDAAGCAKINEGAKNRMVGRRCFMKREVQSPKRGKADKLSRVLSGYFYMVYTSNIKH